MESHISLYVLVIVLSILFAELSKSHAIKNNEALWKNAPFYLLLLTFTFIIGTRYMVGTDYPQYMIIVNDGDRHYYYHSIEYLNRFLIDITNNNNLDFYWWFIFMAFAQISFLVFAVKNSYKKIFPWIIFCFFLLYISHYLNIIRQGVALSCFMLATTYIKDRKLYYYLFFILIGSLFHRSILLWIPVYWFVNKELLKSIKLQYILLFISILIMPRIIERIFQIVLPFIEHIGYGDKFDDLNTNEANIQVGSGLGVLFRYTRWCIIIAFYKKLKTVINEKELIPIYNLFFIGIILDAATYHVMVLNRMVMYAAIHEIYILALLFYYSTKTKFKQDKIIILILLLLQTILSFLSIFRGTYVWYTIWDIPEYITP